MLSCSQFDTGVIHTNLCKEILLTVPSTFGEILQLKLYICFAILSGFSFSVCESGVIHLIILSGINKTAVNVSFYRIKNAWKSDLFLSVPGREDTGNFSPVKWKISS